MTSDDLSEEENGEEGQAADEPTRPAPPASVTGGAGKEAPVEPKSAPAAPDTAPENGPDSGDEADSGMSLMTRLNPLRMFSKFSPEGHVREGQKLSENGSYAQATVAFQNALKMDAKNVKALRGLGKVFFKKGGRSNMETALGYYQEAVRHKSTDFELYAITAKIYDALGKRKEATLERKKFVIVRALEGDSGNPIANNNMGILSLQQGAVNQALSYFARALRTDKNYDMAHRNIAATYVQMAKKEENPEKKNDFYNKAKEEIQKAIEITPSFPSLLSLARILLREGSFEETLEKVQVLDEMTPANKDVYLIKKMALEGMGRFEEARDAQLSLETFVREENRPTSPEESAPDEQELQPDSTG